VEEEEEDKDEEEEGDRDPLDLAARAPERYAFSGSSPYERHVDAPF
jgi:hypothetical protein